VVLTLVEEIVLLALDDTSGKFIHVPEHAFRYAISGAVLMDLAFQGKIDTDLERLFVLDPEETGDDLLDPTLRSISGSQEQHDASYWIQHFGSNSETIRARALQRLCDAGILKTEDNLFLWVFKSRRYPTRDGLAEKEVKQRIMSILFSEEIPDPRDTAIIGLADACGILRRFFSRQQYQNLRGRIDEIQGLESIGQTVSNIVREIETQLARATAMGPVYG